MSDQTSSFFRAQATSAGVEFTVAVVPGEVSGGVNEAYRETHSRALVSRLKPAEEPSVWPAPPHLLTLAEDCGYAILVARDGAFLSFFHPLPHTSRNTIFLSRSPNARQPPPSPFSSLFYLPHPF